MYSRKWGVKAYKISTIVDSMASLPNFFSGVKAYKISTIVDMEVIVLYAIMGVKAYKISTIVDSHPPSPSGLLV